jgi:serine/threonine-protein kinase
LYDFIKHLNRRKRLRTFLIKDIACGLFELHSRNLAHCDIKPQNVLIDRINGRPTAVLTDFGITHILTEELLQVKAFEIANLRGLSVGYAAPETFTRYRLKSKASAAIVKAGDIYSFSCVVYFLVRRRSPWNS